MIMNKEDRKEMLSVMINICTRVVTLIFIVVSIFNKAGFLYKNTEVSWGMNDILGVLIIGIASGLLFGLFYIKKNISGRIMLVLQIIYFLILNSILLFVGLYLGWFVKEFSSIIKMEIIFVLIYFVVTLLLYFFDFNEAKKINQKLQSRKKKNACN